MMLNKEQNTPTLQRKRKWEWKWKWKWKLNKEQNTPTYIRLYDFLNFEAYELDFGFWLQIWQLQWKWKWKDKTWETNLYGKRTGESELREIKCIHELYIATDDVGCYLYTMGLFVPSEDKYSFMGRYVEREISWTDISITYDDAVKLIKKVPREDGGKELIKSLDRLKRSSEQ